MITASDALRIISENIPRAPLVTISVDDALGCTLGEEIIASGNIPPFDNAAMDGYALRAEDVASVPTTLRLAGEIAAGHASSLTLFPHEAVSIMTGAPIPGGCTAVVQYEWTVRPDADHVTVLRNVPEGHNVRKQGADIADGSVALRKGTLVRPQEIGLLASLGRRYIAIHRKPRVAVLATGDELVEIDKRLLPGTIRNSNAHLLHALIRQAGCEVILSEIARDDPDELRRKVALCLQADMVVTTGGVSVGKYDLVCEAYEHNGISILFRKVKIKPGMPLVFGVRPPVVVFGLPGNPVSTMVTFLKFVRPALDLMTGRGTPGKKYQLHARLAETIVKSDGKRHYVRGVLGNDPDGLVVKPTGSQVSNVLTSMVKADCLIILEEEKSRFNAGEFVEIELMP